MELNQLNIFFNPWKRRIMGMVRRLTISGSDDSFGLMRLQIETLKDVVQNDVERVQSYGFTSRPLKGAEGVVVYLGGNQDHGVVIAVDDVRYRIKGMAEGEVAIYTDEGDKIHLKRNREVEITTMTLTVNAETAVNINTGDALVNASGDVTIQAAADVLVQATSATVQAQETDVISPVVSITAATGVTMTTPLLTVTGLVACAGIGAGAAPVAGKAKVSGDIESTGNVKDATGTMAAIRSTYNGHAHSGVSTGSSNSGTTTAPM